MATKESLQIRELAARQTLREALDQMSALIGVELPAPVIDPSPDPTYRNIVEWERVARDILALQAGLTISQPTIPGDDIPNASEEVELDTAKTTDETQPISAAPDVEPVIDGTPAVNAETPTSTVEAAPTEPVAEVEPKAKGKKK